MINPMRWFHRGEARGEDGTVYGEFVSNEADPDTTWIQTHDGELHQGYKQNELN